MLYLLFVKRKLCTENIQNLIYNKNLCYKTTFFTTHTRKQQLKRVVTIIQFIELISNNYSQALQL